MKICKECGKSFPFRKRIDGKIRNLKNRTKCLDCMPFGSSIFASSCMSEEDRKIKYKNPLYLSRKAKNMRDFYHRQKENINKKSSDRKIGLVKITNGCQICGHTNPWNIAYHHHDGLKDFTIDKRQCQYSWSKVKPELLKCIAVCHNCHGDIHHGLIDKTLIEQLFDDFKAKIEQLTDYPI